MMESNLVNKELLIQYKSDLENLELWKSIKDLDKSDKTSELYCMKQTSINIDKCFEVLEQGQSITAQLEEIKDDVDNYWYNDECDKSIVDVPITDLIKLFKQFKFRNYQEELVHFVKINIGWRNKDRDIKIYKQIKQGTHLSELADEYDLTISAISKIKNKVQSSINNLKGRLFEIEFEKYLRSLDIFRNCEIVRNGKPGQPDIYITTKKKELFVLSLKNLELKDSHAIIVDKLKPEIQFAFYNSTFEKLNKVMLYLIVFNSLTERIHIKEVDYKNPKNINIHS